MSGPNEMHTQRQHAAIEARSREVLDESAGRLDGRTLSRLTQARHAALAQLGEPRNVWWRGWMPAGATAAVAVLAVALFTLRPDTGGLPVATANGEAIDTELLADVEALELAEADDELEFYEWAAREAAATELGS